MSRRKHLDQVGAAALEEALVASDLVDRARAQASRQADRRRRAVLLANEHGASYPVIASTLKITVSGVQQIVGAARDRRAAG